MTSCATVRAELMQLLQASSVTNTPVASLVSAGVRKVYNHEPAAGNMEKPVCITVVSGEVTPEDYQFIVRVYIDASQDAQQAEELKDTVIDALDDLLTDDFGPSNYSPDFGEEINSFVITSVLTHGREDF